MPSGVYLLRETLPSSSIRLNRTSQDSSGLSTLVCYSLRRAPLLLIQMSTRFIALSWTKMTLSMLILGSNPAISSSTHLRQVSQESRSVNRTTWSRICLKIQQSEANTSEAKSHLNWQWTSHSWPCTVRVINGSRKMWITTWISVRSTTSSLAPWLTRRVTLGEFSIW